MHDGAYKTIIPNNKTKPILSWRENDSVKYLFRKRVRFTKIQ